MNKVYYSTVIAAILQFESLMACTSWNKDVSVAENCRVKVEIINIMIDELMDRQHHEEVFIEMIFLSGMKIAYQDVIEHTKDSE